MTGLRIVVGADDAGVEYKYVLRRDLEADERVTSVLVGASSVAQLDDSLAALDNLGFDDDELAAIDQHAVDAGINIWSRSSES